MGCNFDRVYRELFTDHHTTSDPIPILILLAALLFILVHSERERVFAMDVHRFVETYQHLVLLGMGFDFAEGCNCFT